MSFIEPPFWSRNLSRVGLIHAATRFVAPLTPPTEPITLAMAKDFLRVASAQTDEDDLIGRYIKAARAFVENRIYRSLVPMSVDVVYDALASTYGWLTLPYPPLVSVTSITTIGVDGAATVIDPSLYLVDTSSEPGRIGLPNGQPWPMNLRAFQPVTVRIVVGYTVVPEDLVQAMRLLVAHYFENRVASSLVGAIMPMGIDEHLAPYQIVDVA
jgi:uncharacterized phiE125 gp8 family phage protein